ncbi:hypothetical protein RchiOBHm_Chr7g0178221 [Rosa chinensis]|uniref:Uncharacterized protein n=1 Tax=Rosa chinensis TaxID=74649 RepID=A0A2P6P1S6_ROSCH|nr:uncharacterized protein LOC112180714 [Rosa chinensis]PRQ15882.1 hypothetical protein RchiOBHm_Chr7g0178221 [Rosa chinensis]
MPIYHTFLCHQLIPILLSSLSLSLFLNMGNAAASCVPSRLSNSTTVKVLFFDGRLEVYIRPIKAAELMLEHSGQFVVESSSLRVGNRIHGLTADEELERRRFYFLLPMDLLYSVLTHEELSALTYKASRALKHRGSFNNFSKIFPVLSEFFMFPNSESKPLDGSDHHSPASNSLVPLLETRYSKQRSWKPALETIVETSTTCPH